MSSLRQQIGAAVYPDRQLLKDELATQGFTTTVFTNGCFDILHRGHANYLAQARELGDCLIVGLNSDQSVRHLKGAERPVHTWEDRAWLLAAMKAVDYVVYFDEATPATTLQLLQPTVHCKGGDYQPTDLPEKAVIDQYGGQIVILPFVAGHSTTNILKTANRIQV